MAYSTQRAVSDGTLVTLPLSIDYFERSEITVYFNSTPTTTGWAWVGTTDKTLTFTPAVPAGVEVLVKRTTLLDKARNVFSAGAQFLARTLDENTTQVLRVAQEVREGAGVAEVFNDLNMHGYKINNLADATNGDQPVTLRQYIADANSPAQATAAANQAIAAAQAAVAAAQAAAGTATTLVSAFSASLASGTGSALIGYLSGAVGAVVRSLADKLADNMSTADFGAKGNGVTDDTVAIKRAITALALKGCGKLVAPAGSIFVISDTLDFTELGVLHRTFNVDFRGAIFLWGGGATSTKPMIKLFNNKSTRITNFTLLGNTGTTKTAVTGIWVDSLQPQGCDLLGFSDFRISLCQNGVRLGSTGAGQNRVSDSSIGHFVIEGCTNGIVLESTDVDSLTIGPCGIISACTVGVLMNRAGFVKLYNITGYACGTFVLIAGPTESILIENCQSERGDLTAPVFLYRKNYTLSRNGPLTFLNCVIDDRVWLDYDAALGSDAQVVNFIGGIMRGDLSVDCPDTTINLIGFTQIDGAVMAIGGTNSRVYNFGSRLYGTTLDYARAVRTPLYGDIENNFAAGVAPGNFASTGRTVIYAGGATGGLFGLGANGANMGYLAASTTVVELAATAAGADILLTTALGITARGRTNGAFRIEPRNAYPANPVKGDLCMRDDLSKLYLWDGAAWRAINMT